MATSLTKNAQNQRKLQHLHAASRLLFANSPAVSAHLATRLRSVASSSGTPLPESAFRSQCACCGYLLVPGWTAKVRLRGHRVEGDREVGATVSAAPTERRQRTKSNQRKTIGDHSAEPTPQNGEEKADGDAQKRRKLKRKRKRVSKPRDENERIPRPRPTPTAVYTCLLCDRKTTQALPPTSSSTSTATAATHAIPSTTIKSATVLQTPTSSSSLLSSSDHKPATTTTINTITKLEPTKATASPTTVLNSSSKKRAKARKKSTLSDMLSKEKQRSESSSGNFGLDLMDLMKTS